jgi:ribosomal protein S18 acetylase RimI-like enzyme
MEQQMRLRPIREDEMPALLAREREGYVRQMVDFGRLSPGEARKKMEKDVAQVFPGGRPGEDLHLFAVELGATAEQVGTVYFELRKGVSPVSIYIYGMEIDEGFRGRGFGRQAMLLIEEQARQLGAERIDLNVFGGNAVARGLYRSLGYEETAVNMSKPLGRRRE